MDDFHPICSLSAMNMICSYKAAQKKFTFILIPCLSDDGPEAQIQVALRNAPMWKAL